MRPVPATTGDDTLADSKRCVVEYFKRIPTPLYAIVDSAHDHRYITAFLQKAGCNHCALFGKELAELTDGRGPYLVCLSPGEGFLESLIGKAWGRSWGIYLTGAVDLRSLRRHLARLVSVKIEGDKTALFRFYDPRILQPYLTICSQEELESFFGSIKSFYLESDDGRALIQFSYESAGDQKGLTRLTHRASYGSKAPVSPVNL